MNGFERNSETGTLWAKMGTNALVSVSNSAFRILSVHFIHWGKREIHFYSADIHSPILYYKHVIVTVADPENFQKGCDPSYYLFRPSERH